MKTKKTSLLLTIVFLPLFVSCSSMRAAIYLSSIDSNSGAEILQNESNVKIYLENILQCPQNYTIHTYSRRSIAYKIPKTKLLAHEYYTIYEFGKEFHTLSFYGSKFAFTSEGTWAIDTDADLGSYKSFLTGENNWEVKEITPDNGIDVEKTISNIIKKIDSNITYYYRDHIKDKPNVDNCITALNETCVEKE